MDYNCQKVEGLKLGSSRKPYFSIIGSKSSRFSFQSSEMDLAKRELLGAAG